MTDVTTLYTLWAVHTHMPCHYSIYIVGSTHTHMKFCAFRKKFQF